MTHHAKLTDIMHSKRAENRRVTLDQGQPVAVSNWLDTIPVAAAIFAYVDGDARMVAHNSLFRQLGFDENRGNAPYNLELAAFMQSVIENEGDVRLFKWRSPNTISRRTIDITVARHPAGEKKHPHFLMSFVDRTAEAENQLNLRREMMSDSLTGLANRTGFEEQVEAYIDERTTNLSEFEQRPKFAVMSVDLSRFSRVNECAGSIVGDELIISVASRLRSAIRKHDLMARLGGNEFGIFVELDCNETNYAHLAARVEAAFADPYRLSEMEVQVDAAIGIAVGTMADGDPADIIRYAQIALKRAKTSNKPSLYAPEVLQQARHRFSIETDLRKAIEKDLLHLEFQPLVNLTSGTITGFEALARWHDPDRGNVSPVDFIPVAEECGLIVPLGRWALEKSASTLAGWDRNNGDKLPVKVNVNLSAVQFARDNVASVVEEVIRCAKLDGERLTLELTESVILSDPDRAVRVMESLKGLNTCLAMDDFGTGYSNLAYLQRLPIDILKIDRSFVTQMLEDKDKVSIVRAVLSLADALGMQTTAEGIETLELSHTLAALGCSHGQGFYYARPLSADKAYAYYQENAQRVQVV
ncbi:bifunctional diguanylate cyclase/phosphodiesterase [Sphingorhabdus sp. Alg239-R122]|uniref:putative bifunctional diguanylate cyclase/phosphodiesterase n=1 Tax=Sphingorhabdus sp. Alg239-R122 TaxID=2305989 RepID=UPI0013D9DC19|nr:bifunctional diguanylate cyclase/phosphodiesterase [Sphingorhabdus sp. Alg239-R122]